MPTSTRMGFPYPAKDQDPWDATFESFVNAVDQASYSSREDRNFMLTKGGTLTFTASSGLLTWSDAIELTSPVTGFLIRIAAGSITTEEGAYLYVSLVRAPTGNIGVTLVSAQQVPPSNEAFAIAIRKDGRIYFRTGAVLGDGDSVALLESGGASLPTIATGQIYIGNATNAPQARDVTGDVEIDATGVATIQPDAVDTAELVDGAVTPIKADRSVTWDFPGGATSSVTPTNANDLANKDYVDTHGGGGVTAHSALTGLGPPADDHTQYALLAGRSGGQILIGGSGAGEDLTLASTSDGTKGDVIVSDAAQFNGNMTMVGDNDFVPQTDNQGEIGTASKRFSSVRAAIVQAGDLHLRSTSGDVHWILVEASDGIYAKNVVTGKKYRMLLEEVDE